jgi:uncharacterized Zn-finger protein
MADEGAVATPANPAQAVEVAAADLPAFCPNPRMALWSSHPRVYLDLEVTGEASCPYCGTRYRIAGGAAGRRH